MLVCATAGDMDPISAAPAAKLAISFRTFNLPKPLNQGASVRFVTRHTRRRSARR
jgi:hypothetical protein